MNENERLKYLIRGLVGPHTKKYYNNPYFRYTILLMAQGLIDTVDNGIERETQAMKFADVHLFDSKEAAKERAFRHRLTDI